MATNQEQVYVGKTTKERIDYSEGWERGYFTPYYPKVREETVLANIAKVSPAFVAGYKEGKFHSDQEELRTKAEYDAHLLEEDLRAQWQQDATDVDKFIAGLED